MSTQKEYPTLHDALKTLPRDMVMRDLYRLFGGEQTVGDLLTAPNDSNYFCRLDREKYEIGPLGDVAILRET